MESIAERYKKECCTECGILPLCSCTGEDIQMCIGRSIEIGEFKV